MKLEILKCPSCGANIEFTEDIDACECEYCGAKVTKTSAHNNRNSNSGLTNPPTSNTNKVDLKNVKSSVNKTMRKGITFVFNALFIATLLFAGICLIIAITESNIDMVFAALFFAIYSIMFKVLALTPKGSKCILGKEKGLKPVYFVLICVLLSFMMILLSPSSESATDTNNDNDSSISQTVESKN